MLDRIKSLLKSPLVLILAAVVLIAALIVVAARLGLFAAIFDSPWFWEIVLALAAIVIFVLIFRVIPWFKEYRFVHRETSEYRIAGEESPAEFRDKFLTAMRQLKALPHTGKDDPLYSLPWYLMLGAGQCGKTAALEAVDGLSPLTAIPVEGGTQNCDWWVSNPMVVLDTCGRYAIHADTMRNRTEWYRLLRLVRHYHSREPISGLLVAVAANELLTQPLEKLRADAGEIRLRIEEAIQELDFDFPVYLLVTKCDLIEGFKDYFSLLPSRIASEVVGWIDQESLAATGAQARGSAEALQRFRAGVHSIYERLHFLRLSMLNGRTPEALRQPIFCFPEEFRAIERPLMIFAQQVIGRQAIYRTPMFRGVFFLSAKQEGTPVSSLRRELGILAEPAAYDGRAHQHYFLQELFGTILPRDRTLAAPATARSKSA